VPKGVLVPFAGGLGRGPDALDDLIDGFAFVSPKGVTQQFPEQPYVFTEWLVWIVHAPVAP
jgi:hypothetical protein